MLYYETPPDTIIVTIPAQEYSVDKYSCMWPYKRCYLEDALDLAGYHDSMVANYGKTIINGYKYRPTEAFSGRIVEEAFNNNESITVTLQRI